MSPVTGPQAVRIARRPARVGRPRSRGHAARLRRRPETTRRRAVRPARDADPGSRPRDPPRRRRGSRAGATRSRRTSGSPAAATTSTDRPRGRSRPGRSGRRRFRRGRRADDGGSAGCGRRWRPGRGSRSARDDQERARGLPMPHGCEPGEVALEGVVDVERGQGQVDLEPAARVGRRRRPRRGRRTSSTNSAQRSVAISKPAAPACPPWRMKSVDAGLEGRAEVEPAVAPAGRPDDVAELGADDRRSPQVVDQPRRPRARRSRPATALGRSSPRRSPARGGRGRFGHRRLDLGHRLARQVAPRLVRRLELGRQPVRLVPVVGQEQGGRGGRSRRPVRRR